ncbi:MAG: hypothetical protein LBR10_00435 [Prevotellaceae bacterium]|jgi:antitoxin (DNA-binding transcriptional repressor) of toxin-antitoxin stability system|nr:hypothetical protein [Prevotellaceae bacterium]
MKTVAVEEVKAHFSDILLQVKNGEKVTICEKLNAPIAMIVPIKNRAVSRKIGILNGIASFKTKGNGKITEEEFLGL